MTYDVVFHLDLDDEKILMLALSNISNFYNAPQSKGAEIVLLANGPAVKLFSKGNAPKELTELQAKGASIRLCQNALNKFELEPAHLEEGILIVPAGIVELIELQNKGFSYIKP